jgi:hypothetical protein
VIASALARVGPRQLDARKKNARRTNSVDSYFEAQRHAIDHVMENTNHVAPRATLMRFHGASL